MSFEDVKRFYERLAEERVRGFLRRVVLTFLIKI